VQREGKVNGERGREYECLLDYVGMNAGRFRQLSLRRRFFTAPQDTKMGNSD
jgi:hypothetical protein